MRGVVLVRCILVAAAGRRLWTAAIRAIAARTTAAITIAATTDTATDTTTQTYTGAAADATASTTFAL